jgi:hypothetical protein
VFSNAHVCSGQEPFYAISGLLRLNEYAFSSLRFNMSNSATSDWDEDIFEEDDSAVSNLDEPQLSRKQKLDIRRKLEDRMEMKRLRAEIDDLDMSWLD